MIRASICCGATPDFARGFLAAMRVCVMAVLLQSTTSFFAVGMLVKAEDSFSSAVKLGGNFTIIFATGSFAILAFVLTLIDALVQWRDRCSKSDTDTSWLTAPLASNSSAAPTLDAVPSASDAAQVSRVYLIHPYKSS